MLLDFLINKFSPSFPYSTLLAASDLTSSEPPDYVNTDGTEEADASDPKDSEIDEEDQGKAKGKLSGRSSGGSNKDELAQGAKKSAVSDRLVKAAKKPDSQEQASRPAKSSSSASSSSVAAAAAISRPRQQPPPRRRRRGSSSSSSNLELQLTAVPDPKQQNQKADPQPDRKVDKSSQLKLHVPPVYLCLSVNSPLVTATRWQEGRWLREVPWVSEGKVWAVRFISFY